MKVINIKNNTKLLTIYFVKYNEKYLSTYCIYTLNRSIENSERL